MLLLPKNSQHDVYASWESSQPCIHCVIWYLDPQTKPYPFLCYAHAVFRIFHHEPNLHDCSMLMLGTSLMLSLALLASPRIVSWACFHKHLIYHCSLFGAVLSQTGNLIIPSPVLLLLWIFNFTSTFSSFLTKYFSKFTCRGLPPFISFPNFCCSDHSVTFHSHMEAENAVMHLVWLVILWFLVLKGYWKMKEEWSES